MTLTVDVLMPPKISGRASGSSIERMIWRARQAHAARGVDGVAIGLADPHVGVGEDRRDRQQRQRERDVQELRAAREERDEERDQRDARHGAADVGGRDGQERALAGVAEDQPERERDQRARAPIAARAQLQVLPQQRQVVAAADRRARAGSRAS